MAQVSYGYDAYSSAPPTWTNPSWGVDGAINGNYALYSEKIATTPKYRISETVAPGTDLGTITKVEIGVNWWILGDGTKVTPRIQPEGGSIISPGWTVSVPFVTEYFDVTTEGYGWADFPTLYIDWWLYNNDPDIIYSSLNIDWAWLRITYDEAPAGLGLKLHGKAWADIAKIHGTVVANIAKVHGAS